VLDKSGKCAWLKFYGSRERKIIVGIVISKGWVELVSGWWLVDDRWWIMDDGSWMMDDSSWMMDHGTNLKYPITSKERIFRKV
jgi:hypothetical protein